MRQKSISTVLVVAMVIGGMLGAWPTKPRPAHASVTVTPAAGGGAISEVTTSLGPIVIKEGVDEDIGDGLLLLRAPEGFEFVGPQPDIAVKGDVRTGTAVAHIALGTGSPTLSISFQGDPQGPQTATGTFTIGGVTPILVRSLPSTPPGRTGNVVADAASSVPIDGLVKGLGGTNFGTLIRASGAQASPTASAGPTVSPSPTAPPNPPGVTPDEVIPNTPYEADAFNAVVVTGGGTAAEIAAAIAADSGRPVVVLWFFTSGQWLFALPGLPGAGTLTMITVPLAAIYALLD